MSFFTRYRGLLGEQHLQQQAGELTPDGSALVDQDVHLPAHLALAAILGDGRHSIVLTALFVPGRYQRAWRGAQLLTSRYLKT